MKLILEFLKKVFLRFVNVVTGTVVALYYIYITPLIEHQDYKSALDLAVPLGAVLIGIYLAWRDEVREKIQLAKKIKKLEDNKPKYRLEIIDYKYVIDEKLKEAESLIQKAKLKISEAPSPSVYFPDLPFSPPTKPKWEEYLQRLKEWKGMLEDIAKARDKRIVNIRITNIGASDSDIHVNLRLAGLKQLTDFYEDNIQFNKPEEPSSKYNHRLVSFIPTIQKLGVSCEIHSNEEQHIDVEIDMMRNEDSIDILHSPMFLVITAKVPKISYEIRSKELKHTTGTIPYKFYVDGNQTLVTNPR